MNSINKARAALGDQGRQVIRELVEEDSRNNFVVSQEYLDFIEFLSEKLGGQELNNLIIEFNEWLERR